MFYVDAKNTMLVDLITRKPNYDFDDELEEYYTLKIYSTDHCVACIEEFTKKYIDNEMQSWFHLINSSVKKVKEYTDKNYLKAVLYNGFRVVGKGRICRLNKEYRKHNSDPIPCYKNSSRSCTSCTT